jgi:thiol-disulfide isomerase/thioredoxin
MKQVLYYFTFFILICACQEKANVHYRRSDDIKPVIEYVNTSLTDEQLEKLSLAVTPIRSETKAPFFYVEYNEDIEFYAKNGLAVVVFGASWSGPSKLMHARLHAFAGSVPYPYLYFGYCDVDQFEKLSQAFSIKTVPTTVFIKYNEIKATVIGVVQDETIRALVENYRIYLQ